MECVSYGNISLKYFLAKNQKVFDVGKIRQYDEETEYFENKRFYLLKRPLYENGKAGICGRDPAHLLKLSERQ